MLSNLFIFILWVHTHYNMDLFCCLSMILWYYYLWKNTGYIFNRRLGRNVWCYDNSRSFLCLHSNRGDIKQTGRPNSHVITHHPALVARASTVCYLPRLIDKNGFEGVKFSNKWGREQLWHQALIFTIWHVCYLYL